MDLNRFIITASALPSITVYVNMTKAKKDYVSLYRECAVCGSIKGLEVHHCKPVHVFPELACEFSNFITLCDGITNNGCHNRLGHWGNFKTKFNPNIRQLAVYSRMQMEKEDPARKFLIETDMLIEMFSRDMKMSRGEFLKSITININNACYSN